MKKPLLCFDSNKQLEINASHPAAFDAVLQVHDLHPAYGKAPMWEIFMMSERWALPAWPHTRYETYRLLDVPSERPDLSVRLRAALRKHRRKT